MNGWTSFALIRATVDKSGTCDTGNLILRVYVQAIYHSYNLYANKIFEYEYLRQGESVVLRVNNADCDVNYTMRDVERFCCSTYQCISGCVRVAITCVDTLPRKIHTCVKCIQDAVSGRVIYFDLVPTLGDAKYWSWRQIDDVRTLFVKDVPA